VQVSACVAPNNSPCQTFTLFSTAASLWTLETVSGSSQAVPAGQAFQPLVIRVTDGSPSANPVMGVNVTFTTTLARIGNGGNGLPVILGSSKAQVVTTQDGLASIVPSAGHVGPCDVFITVSAGASTAQFQMESLAAIVPIVPSPPKSGRPKAPMVPRGPELASPAATSPDASLVLPGLFVILEGIPSNDPRPDSSASACPEPSVDDASTDPGSPATANPEVRAANDSAVTAHCPRLKIVGLKVVESKIVESTRGASKSVEAKAAEQAAQVESEAAPAKAVTDAESQPHPASTVWHPEDKRSCRVLADDGPTP